MKQTEELMKIARLINSSMHQKAMLLVKKMKPLKLKETITQYNIMFIVERESTTHLIVNGKKYKNGDVIPSIPIQIEELSKYYKRDGKYHQFLAGYGWKDEEQDMLCIGL